MARWFRFSPILVFFCFFTLPTTLLAGPQVYVSGQGTSVLRFKSDGTARDELLRGYSTPAYSTVDRTNNKFYWGAANKVMRCDFDGSNFEILFDDLDGVNEVTAIAVDPVSGFVFWTEFNGGRVLRGNIDGSGTPTVLYSGFFSLVGIAVDTANSMLYIGNRGGNNILLANISGLGAPSQVVAVGSSLTGVAIDETNGKLYWSEFGDQELERSNLDGSSKETLFNAADGVGAPGGLSVDPINGLLYWGEVSGKVARGNSDGSGTVTELFDITSTDTQVQGAAVATDGAQILFTGDRSVFAGASDGSGDSSVIVDLSNSPDQPSFLAIDVLAQDLYFADILLSSSIRKVDLEFGTTATGILTGTISTLFDSTNDGLVSISGLAHDPTNDRLFWSDEVNQKIQRGSDDGTGTPEDLFTSGDGLASPRDLLFDSVNNLLYWIDETNQTINRGNADGSGAPAVIFNAADGIVAPRALDLDTTNNLLYWGDTTGNQILRGNSDGSGAIDILFGSSDGVATPESIRVDVSSGEIYFTDSGTSDALFRGNADGTGSLETLVSSLDKQNRIAIVSDTDDDGIPDGIDGCSSDAAKTAPGDCGCGVADSDTNSNSISDCLLNRDAKDRISTLRELVKTLKFTGTPNAKKNKARGEAQRATITSITSITREINATIIAHLGDYTLVRENLKLQALLRRARKAVGKARKTKSSNFQRRKKNARRALLKLDRALAA